tara:strand:- start:11 stop:646 length:636 start_codon:yes stop_codon:yes gene_type:complete
MAGPKKKLSTKGFTSGEKATRLNKTLSQFKSYKIPPMPKGVGGASLAEKMVAGGMKTMNSTPNFSKTSNKTMKKVLGFAPGEKLSRVSTVLKSSLAKKVPYVGAALSAVSIGKSVAKIVKNKMAMKSMAGSKGYRAPASQTVKVGSKKLAEKLLKNSSKKAMKTKGRLRKDSAISDAKYNANATKEAQAWKRTTKNKWGTPMEKSGWDRFK